MTNRTFAALLAIGALALASFSLPAAAETAAPAPKSGTTAMHPSALTLRSNLTRAHHQGAGRLGNTRGRQLHTTPTHGTMAGPRI